MTQNFGKQENVYWYEVFDIAHAICTTDYSGSTLGNEVIAQLLKVAF